MTVATPHSDRNKSSTKNVKKQQPVLEIYKNTIIILIVKCREQLIICSFDPL